MKFLNYFKENTLRLIFTFIALYCLLVSIIGFVQNNITNATMMDDCRWAEEVDGKKPEQGIYLVNIVEGGVTDKAGIKEKDILIAINGIEVNSSLEANNILLQHEKDRMVEYTIYRNGEILKFNVEIYKYFNILNIIFSLLGLCFLVVGFLVGYSKPKELTSQIFFFLGCCASLGFGMIGNVSIILNKQLFFILSYQAGIILFFPLFIHFFLSYPIKFDSKYRKQIIAFIYLFVIVLASVAFIFYEYEIYFFSIVLNITLLIYFIFGVVFFILSYRKVILSKEEQLKRALNIIMRGFVLGGLGFGYLFLMPVFFEPAFFLNSTLIFVPCAFVLAIPISFGYSIFRYKILDTEFIVKRGIVFGIITGFVVVLYLLLVFIIDNLLSQYTIENKQLITISLIVIVTFTFDFVNKRVKNFVEKQFYRERYNYRKSLLQFSEELPYLNNISDIISKIGSAVKETIRVKNLNIWIKDHKYTASINGSPKNNESLNIYDRSFTYLFKNDFEPKFLYDINLKNEAIPDEYIGLFKENDIVLSVPVVLKGKLKGSLNFGEKQSGKSYSDEDIDLLKSLASQCAVALENSRLQQEEIHKQQIEEELQIARKIQSDLLPDKDYTIKGLEISGSSVPAKTIGGDFYDLIRLSDTKLLLVVADVSGKGIPAALYMSKIQAMIQFAASLYPSPKDILLEVNKLFIDTLEKKNFITTIMALFDMETGTVNISRAGHNPLLIYKDGNISTLNSKGIGIGVGTFTQFKEELEEVHISVNPGDMLIFYSDGLSESMNKSKEMYGVERISGIIRKNIDSSSEQIKNDILNSIEKFRGDTEQFDDETIVIVKIKS